MAAIRINGTQHRPENDKVVRPSMPPLSGDQRKKYAAKAKEIAEEGRVAMRNVRRDANTKDAAPTSYIKDDNRGLHEEIQKLPRRTKRWQRSARSRSARRTRSSRFNPVCRPSKSGGGWVDSRPREGVAQLVEQLALTSRSQVRSLARHHLLLSVSRLVRGDLRCCMRRLKEKPCAPSLWAPDPRGLCSSSLRRPTRSPRDPRRGEEGRRTETSQTRGSMPLRVRSNGRRNAQQLPKVARER